ncbi:MAG: hypothetical protein A2945_00130 [Candidatus Liptonbacteria bacterium RIFCSPLOWO2_01_FULL_52_25]|uniref:Uncharacterized protein n=1 Tax=Candidatus Liptonbacteria bacterium RIFCSPLOWO2_01_FULL_52_25 TaxID=1798650 RepID=A0A1G2CFB9_9BACT|nr:MAG: hypothetical protein A2945_00130 [Candidatus Liptonbacteria bacterium RIFCSPLOWO2_01_FULL_52_25]
MPFVVGDDGVAYYPVRLVYTKNLRTGALRVRKEILDLPEGERLDEYYICFAPCGVRKLLGTKYAAMKVTKETTEDYDRWSVHGRGASQGKTYTGKDE